MPIATVGSGKRKTTAPPPSREYVPANHDTAIRQWLYVLWSIGVRPIDTDEGFAWAGFVDSPLAASIVAQLAPDMDKVTRVVAELRADPCPGADDDALWERAFAVAWVENPLAPDGVYSKLMGMRLKGCELRLVDGVVTVGLPEGVSGDAMSEWLGECADDVRAVLGHVSRSVA
jgi:hypothetical protein